MAHIPCGEDRRPHSRNLHGSFCRLPVGVLIPVSLGPLAGWTVGFLARADGRERFTLMAEYACRNLAVTALIGVTVLDRPDFLVSGIAFFLAQIPLVLGAVVLFKAGPPADAPGLQASVRAGSYCGEYSCSRLGSRLSTERRES